MLTVGERLISNKLKLDLLCVNTRIKTKTLTDQVYFQGHKDSVLRLLIFLTAGMPSGGAGGERADLGSLRISFVFEAAYHK